MTNPNGCSVAICGGQDVTWTEEMRRTLRPVQLQRSDLRGSGCHYKDNKVPAEASLKSCSVAICGGQDVTRRCCRCRRALVTSDVAA